MYLLAICNVMCCVWVQGYSKGNVQCVGQKRDVSTPNEVIRIHPFAQSKLTKLQRGGGPNVQQRPG